MRRILHPRVHAEALGYLPGSRILANVNSFPRRRTSDKQREYRIYDNHSQGAQSRCLYRAPNKDLLRKRRDAREEAL